MKIGAFAAVALGGAIGSMLRYAVAFVMVEKLGPGFPWHTALINIVGSFCIGLAAAYLQSGAGIAPYVGVFLTVGVLGGFTTFSTFSFDTLTLLSENPALALGYCLGSVLLGVFAAFAGFAAGRALMHAA
ncbi:MAG TPA: fluoride efflux transporter CrcB [Candidatus Tumulicola sp.]